MSLKSLRDRLYYLRGHHPDAEKEIALITHEIEKEQKKLGIDKPI